MLQSIFRLAERGSSVRTEVRAGFTTFLMMAYILLVNPQILEVAGLPAGDVVFATAVASAIACITMGLVANYPFALAPGMGLNAYFTYGVVLGLGIAWQSALAAVFVAGMIFLALSQTGLRSKLVNAIPASLKAAISTGIGLFLAMIGFQNIGLVGDHPATLITRGDLSQPAVLLGVAGIVIIGALMIVRVRGAILIGVILVTVAAWVMGLAPPPSGVFALPVLPSETFGALDFDGALSGTFMLVVAAFLFVDIFDTAGTLIGVGRAGGLLDAQGQLPDAEKAFLADAVGTSAGALLGTSPVTCYIESAAGIEEGGRTGLTAVVVGVLFLSALFLLPIIVAVPAFATGPALIVVGAMMMESAREVNWTEFDNAVPAFLTVVTMPFTYSIADGISLGIVAYCALRVLTGRWKEVSGVMAVLSGLILLYFSVAA